MSGQNSGHEKVREDESGDQRFNYAGPEAITVTQRG